MFKIGDKVRKKQGYEFPGTVVSIFKTTTGKDRLVVEMDQYHMLHIFNLDQMEIV